MTRRELAERSGVPIANIRRVEAGHWPQAATLHRLSDALGVSVVDLVDVASIWEDGDAR